MTTLIVIPDCPVCEQESEGRSGIQVSDNTMPYFVYILANKHNGTLYTGVTNDLVRRVYEHKQDLIEGFTSKYRVHRLVYFEQYQDVLEAITREKRIKKWNREWKIALIEKENCLWCDLYETLT